MDRRKNHPCFRKLLQKNTSLMKENIKGPNKMERHKKRKNMQFLQVLAKAQASIHMIFLQRKIQG